MSGYLGWLPSGYPGWCPRCEDDAWCEACAVAMTQYGHGCHCDVAPLPCPPEYVYDELYGPMTPEEEEMAPMDEYETCRTCGMSPCECPRKS